MTLCPRCGKLVHSGAKARKALRHLKRSGDNTGTLNTYPCPFGYGFHVGHKPQRKKHR